LAPILFGAVGGQCGQSGNKALPAQPVPVGSVLRRGLILFGAVSSWPAPLPDLKVYQARDPAQVASAA